MYSGKIPIDNLTKEVLELKKGEGLLQPPSNNNKTISKSEITLSAAGDHRTSGEVLENILNDGMENFNKWLHPNTNSSWILQTFSSSKVVTGYGLCSANDCPNRDPSEFGLRGLTFENCWIPLHSVATCPFTSRW